LPRRIARYVRVPKADGQEPRGLWRLAQLLDRPVGDFPVVLVLVLLREDAPVHERVRIGSPDELRLRPGRPAAVMAPYVYLLLINAVRLGRVGVVEDLAGGQRGVAVPAKILQQCFGRLESLRRAKPGGQGIDSRRGRPQPGHDARPRRVAERSLAMGI